MKIVIWKIQNFSLFFDSKKSMRFWRLHKKTVVQIKYAFESYKRKISKSIIIIKLFANNLMLNTELDYPLISLVEIIQKYTFILFRGGQFFYVRVSFYKLCWALRYTISDKHPKKYFYINYKEGLLILQNSTSRTSNLNGPCKGLFEQSKGLSGPSKRIFG